MRQANPKAAYLFAVMLLFCLGACTDSQELTLDSKEEDLNHSLTYDCENVEPQAESKDDRSLVLQYLPEVARELRAEDKRVTLRALAVASEMGDLQRAEVLVVEYLCESESE